MYFSNIIELRDCNKLLKLLENSLSHVIDYNLGRWAIKKQTYNNLWLELDVSISENIISADCINISPEFSNDIEYAFYLLIDGKKEEVFWYTDEKSINITLPQEVSSKKVSISGFVREKSNYDKKATRTKALVKNK